MKRVWIFLAFLIGITGVGLAQQPKDQQMLGKPLPLANRPMLNVDGKQVTLGSLKGEKGLVLSFWSNTCPWVAKYEDRFLALARTYQPKGFSFVVVNANDPKAHPREALEAMKERALQKKYPFPYLVDENSALARALGATRTPHVYVYDASGKLVYVGAIDDK